MRNKTKYCGNRECSIEISRDEARYCPQCGTDDLFGSRIDRWINRTLDENPRLKSVVEPAFTYGLTLSCLGGYASVMHKLLSDNPDPINPILCLSSLALLPLGVKANTMGWKMFFRTDKRR